MYILSKVTVLKPFIDIQPIKIDRNALIFFYKQPPYKQLALEASKWQATFRAILFELSNFLKYENCLLHIIDILIKRKMNEQHLYYAKQHRNRNCVLMCLC